MDLFTFDVRMRHDKGAFTFRIVAQSIAHAVEGACAAELAPERAVISVKRVERQSPNRRES